MDSKNGPGTRFRLEVRMVLGTRLAVDFRTLGLGFRILRLWLMASSTSF